MIYDSDGKKKKTESFEQLSKLNEIRFISLT